MKKKLLLLAVAVTCVSVVSACSERAASSYRDGIYAAQAEGYDDSGWKDIVTITVDSGRITGADWNAVAKEGDSKKTLSRTGNYDMSAAGAAAPWHEQAAAMENILVDLQRPEDLPVDEEGYVDGISGVTINVKAFSQLADEALAYAKK